MRALSNDIITKSAQQDQTIAAAAEPYVSLRISRNRTILDNMALTEKVKVRSVNTNTLTDADVAVQHPRFHGENTKIWCVYIHDGKLGLRWTHDQENITEAKWTVVHLGAPTATACAIGFDSEVRENARGYAEFVTGDGYPLVFYVDGEGALHCLYLGGAIIDEVLAAENVTDVSVVRGPSAKYGDWDMGLTVFFLMNGQLYYRQLIKGVWYDAEIVTLGIENETFAKIDAFNTWDYRVGVQILTNNGKLYQIITYTEGIGVRSTEHLDLSLSAKVTLSGINYRNEYTREHLELGMSATALLIYGLSSVPTAVANTDATTIQVTFDYPVYSDEVTNSMFTLVDSNGIDYLCHGFTISGGGTGRILTLTFDNFNLAAAAQNMTLTYTAPESGGLMSPAVQTESFTETFVPTGLVMPTVDPPTYDKAKNNKAGTKIRLTLTEEYTNYSLSGMDDNFSLALQEYEYVPNGALLNTTRAIATVTNSDGYELEEFETATLNNTVMTNGIISLEEDE